MCGIAGQFLFDGRASVRAEDIRRMCETLVHRGPDDHGTYVRGQIGLGHTRLSIIDLGAGHQPLSNEDGTVWVVFNGEIYNYVELREQLLQRGHQFATQTDTEVIVHLYEEKGEECVRELRGMFAIALWDDVKKKLVLARDRFGKKPLYYAHREGEGLCFGSEIKALFPVWDVPRRMNVEALDAYLSLLYVPSPLSMFDGIQKLPAGHLLVASDDHVVIREYWDLHFAPSAVRSEHEWLEQLEAILREAVNIRLRSDVPIGAFLSGGVDSTVVVAMMAELMNRPVVTCSVGFEQDAHNELPFAKAASLRFHTEHYEHVIQPHIAELVPKLVEYFDEPFGDSSAVPTYYVSEMIRQHAKVALSGDGGDEVFAGYSRHYLQQLECRLRAILAGMPNTMWYRRLVRALPAMPGRGTLEKLSLEESDAYAFKHYHVLFTPTLKAAVYTGDLQTQCRSYDPADRLRTLYRKTDATNPLDKALYVDLKTYLVDDILVKVDRMSMAHSLEVRAPLLDHRFVEFTAAIPSDLKLRKTETKVLLKRMLDRYFPSEFVRRPKHGFTMPIEEWLKREPLRQVVDECLFSSRAIARGLFNPATVRNMWEQYVSGVQDYGHHFWMMVQLELWFRRYVDGGKP